MACSIASIINNLWQNEQIQQKFYHKHIGPVSPFDTEENNIIVMTMDNINYFFDQIDFVVVSNFVYKIDYIYD